MARKTLSQSMNNWRTKAKACKTCGKPIPSTAHGKTLYCGSECKPQVVLNEPRNKTLPAICTATKGALIELTVATYLLDRGYEVYRNLSPSGSADLVVIRNGAMRSLEVRTAQKYLNGRLNGSNKRNRANILVLVHSGNITFEPELDI